MCDQALPARSRTDITIEFYHKTAIYKSKITGAEVPINIKSVEHYVTHKFKEYTLVTSTNGVTYLLDDLTLPGI